MKSMAVKEHYIHVKNLAFLALHFIITISGAQAGTVFNVEEYGAVGDGKHDATKAFVKAWGAACKTPSAIMLVPGSKTFYVNNLSFVGPCHPSLIFQVDGTIIAPPDPNRWQNKKIWLLFENLQQFTLAGSGTIDGQGKDWWENNCSPKNGIKYCKDDERPTAIQFYNGKRIVIKGLHATNSPRFHMIISNCHNLKISGVKITSPEDSPNTDGIDIFGSKNVLIQGSTIGTGDDCIAIGDGSFNIRIKDTVCGPGHGISIGSLGRGDTAAYVHSVYVEGAKLVETTNGLRIKTWQGGSGLASNITYENVEMVNVNNPIIIDQHYCDSPIPCRNQRSAVKISKVTYKNISGTSASKVAVQLDCSHRNACTDIKMVNVRLTQPSGVAASSVCRHARVQSSGTVRPSCCKGHRYYNQL